jgi:hypothetical protein
MVEVCLSASLAYILFEAESDQVTLVLSSKLSEPIRVLSNVNLFSWFGIYVVQMFYLQIIIHL